MGITLVLVGIMVMLFLIGWELDDINITLRGRR